VPPRPASSVQNATAPSNSASSRNMNPNECGEIVEDKSSSRQRSSENGTVSSTLTGSQHHRHHHHSARDEKEKSGNSNAATATVQPRADDRLADSSTKSRRKRSKDSGTPNG
jgi:hypothetical protein